MLSDDFVTGQNKSSPGKNKQLVVDYTVLKLLDAVLL